MLRERTASLIRWGQGRPYLLLTLTALFWSGNMVVGRGLNDAVPPLTLAVCRWSIVLALLLPWVAADLPRHLPVIRQHWRSLGALGLVGVAGYNTFAYLALQSTTATNAALLNSFIPIATIALAFVLLGRRLGLAEGIGVLISLAGVVTIISRGSLDVLQSLALNQGDLWMLVAVAVWGLYTVGLHWRPASLPPLVFLTVITAIGLVVLLPFWAWEWLSGNTAQWHTASLLGVAYVGVFPGFLGYVFYNAGVASVGPARGSLFIHLMPVFATALATVFLGETPRPYHALGIALVLGGVMLVTRAARRA